MSVFSNIIKNVLAVRNSVTGDFVRYYEGDAYIEILATKADGQRKGDQSDVIRVGSQQDWLVMVADLEFSGQLKKPKRGHLIVLGAVKYEVLPQNNDDVYRMSGDDQYRIHTKVVFCG